MINLSMKHLKWLRPSQTDETPRFITSHPAVIAFKNELKKRREWATEYVVSTDCLSLPFAVQTQIEEKSNLFFVSSIAKVVYVELKAMNDSYTTVNDADKFEQL